MLVNLYLLVEVRVRKALEFGVQEMGWIPPGYLIAIGLWVP